MGVPEVVERVARAMRRARWNTETGWIYEIDGARAAIGAMREPTEAMRHAVWYDQYITCGGTPEMADQLARQRVENPTQREQDLSSFGALIDAALAEPTAPR